MIKSARIAMRIVRCCNVVNIPLITTEFLSTSQDIGRVGLEDLKMAGSWELGGARLGGRGRGGASES